MMLFVATIGLGAVLAAIYFYFQKQYGYWGKLGFPHTEPSFPWGDASGIARTRNIGQVINDLYDKFPKDRFVGFWLIQKATLLIRDPELVKSVFVRDFMTFHDRGIYVNEKDDPLSAHLFSIAGTKWRNLRVKLSPTFTSGKMKMMFPILVECSKQFQKVLEEPASRGEVIEVKDYAARFTTDIISLAAFGIETDSLHKPDAEFRHYGEMIFKPTFIEAMKGMMQAMVPEIARFFSIRTNKKEVSDFFLKAFGESMAYREDNKIRRNDFMDLLIQLKNQGKLDDVDGDGSTKFTFEEAAAQAFVFFVAGFETSSTTMQFALYELAKNPDIQEKAREETKRVLAKYNGEISYECVMELDYLGKVIDETLRLYPPVPFLQRECNKDWKIPDSDLVVPKGITVIIDCIGLHHDEQHYPNPEKFDPERFTEEAKASRHHYAYLPFGEGPRNCIGMRFGLMQTRVGMMTLLNNYKFSVAKETPIPMVYDPKSFILSPKDGMNIRINKI